jgi:hypothetical protein
METLAQAERAFIRLLKLYAIALVGREAAAGEHRR